MANFEGLCPILVTDAPPSPFPLKPLPPGVAEPLPASNIGPDDLGQTVSVEPEKKDEDSGITTALWLCVGLGLGVMVAKGVYETRMERQTAGRRLR